MKLITEQWIEMAEGNLTVAERAFRVRKKPYYDPVCLHSEFCAEQYLKAYLQEKDVSFPVLSSLAELLDLLSPIDIKDLDSNLQIELRSLTELAYDAGYPGFFVDKAKAKETLRICKATRQTIRASLGL